jgi:flagellar M-ring protein FliF
MPNVDLGALRRQGARAFSGFTAGQRTMLGLAVIGTVLGGMLFLRMSSGTEYAPLFTDLEASDAAEVTAALDGQGVAYRLEDGGRTVMVPRTDVYRTRIDLSADGLPRGGDAGYELLDDQGITTSEFRQRVDYQRALEGELARTIESIDGVEDAIVHLVIPEDDLFSGDAQHPSASVLVSTTEDGGIAAGQVQAVVNLVASSVEGLEADQVTVADGAGRVLSAPGEDGLAAAAGDARTSQTAGFEGAMAARIEEMLVPVTGTGRARVNVTAQLDFDRRETTSESFGQPDTAPVISETTDTETFQGDSAAVGGVLGPDGIPIDAEAGEGSSYERSSTERVFANQRITEVVQDAPGDVQRLSVAVLLDEAAGIDVRAVEQLVAAGAGIDTARGDTLEVTQLPFDTSAADAAAAELADARSAEERGQLFSLLRTVGSVAIVAVVLFLAWRSTRKAAVARFPVALPLEVADPDDRGLPAGPASADGDDAATSTALPPVEAIPAGPSEADLQREELQGQITDLIDRQPEDVAQVLRSWMTERV